MTISCCLRSRFESCNGVIVPNLLVFQLLKPKEMFIYIAKEFDQLYKLYDTDMIYRQLLVNLTKPMRFMSEAVECKVCLVHFRCILPYFDTFHTY